MAYTIPKVQPFLIHGQKGDYMIQPLATMSTDDVGELMTLTQDTPAAERVAAVKSFLLKQAPELEKEELGDFGYSQLFAAYEKEQGLGK